MVPYFRIDLVLNLVKFTVAYVKSKYICLEIKKKIIVIDKKKIR